MLATGIAGAGVPSPASSVLSPGYAKSVGFPEIAQSAKTTAVTTEKGCSTTYEAVYEDAARRTALVSDVLNCRSAAAAADVLGAVRRHVRTDGSIRVPKELGSSAFATASDAPQYLVVWKAGSRVAITAIDVDLTGTSASEAAPEPLTAAQRETLQHAALRQNSLYG